MKRFLVFLLALALLFLAACGLQPASPGDAAALPGVAGPLPEAVSGWAELYAAFVKKNYAALSEDCYGGVAGAGFIDLDLDGTPELVLFDSGASAYMGVQLFDLADGQVTCVSASAVAVGEDFGGAYFSRLYVDTLFFEDFRLLESPDGRRWFEVVSKNGAEDFYYNERLRFSGTDGVLTLTSVCYKRVVTDPAAGTELSADYTVGGLPADAAAYALAEQNAQAAGKDTGYDAAGVFLWTDKSYGTDFDGLAAMLDAAAAAYVPIE